MDSSKTHGFYSLVDDDDDSDVTAINSVESLEKTLWQSQSKGLRTTSSPSTERRKEARLVWLRWSIVVVLQTVIVVLLAIRPTSQTQANPAEVETGGDINGLYPTRKFLSPLNMVSR
jgi:hypothetical protein